MSHIAKILVMMTGGTIAQAVDSSGRMQIARTVDDLVGMTDVACSVETFSFGARTGANLTSTTVLSIVNKIEESRAAYDGFVLITGTDSMEELAFLLHSVVDMDAPLVLTGAMKPSDILGYDGIANLQQAIMIAAAPQSKGRGVLLAMNDQIHFAPYVRKTDSQLIGAFQSHPGPVGEFRRGNLIYYFNNPAPSPKFPTSAFAALDLNIPVLIHCFDQPFLPGMFEGAAGAVIAGMGTASISERWIEQLSPAWTSRIPIVLVSRSMKGTNFDDFYYRGSREKYEERGFLLTEFEHLNPMQARIYLALKLATQS